MSGWKPAPRLDLMPEGSAGAPASRAKNRSKIVREATTSATETITNTSICAANPPMPSIASSPATSAPTPNHRRKKPGVNTSAARKTAATISQMTHSFNISVDGDRE